VRKQWNALGDDYLLPWVGEYCMDEYNRVCSGHIALTISNDILSVFNYITWKGRLHSPNRSPTMVCCQVFRFIVLLIASPVHPQYVTITQCICFRGNRWTEHIVQWNLWYIIMKWNLFENEHLEENEEI
jgi:hypothetical protein